MRRREFVRLCTMAAAAVGLGPAAAVRFVDAAERGRRPSVIWLQFQECTGCTESLLRTTHPAVDDLILDLISLDYHETLLAAAGHQAEAALRQAMRTNTGKYVCVVEGAIPTKDNGIYCMIGGRTALEIVKDVAGQAGAVIAIGSCASWGGIPSAGPNPTGAVGVHDVLKGTTVVNIPGCPANPYNFLGTVLQYATYGTLPALDAQGRPKFAYGETIHEHCPRRAHFDAGRFANAFGDEGHRNGWCLYKLGCKGPATFANCSVQHFCEVDNAWPIGLGAPCFGCTEQRIAFTIPAFQTIEITRPSPPDTYAPIRTAQGGVSPVATGVAGAILGGLAGAGYVASKKFTAADTPAPSDPAAERAPEWTTRAEMGISRRTALKGLMVAGAAVAGVRPAHAAVLPQPPDEALGLLYDATLCIGCKTCMVACNEANGLPADTTGSPAALYHSPLDLSAKAKTVIKLYSDGSTRSFVKAQCMHCIDPACASACMLGALQKREFGIVTYDADLCVGCRYCEVGCPFGVPKFEWAKTAPKIVKCELCKERLAEGKEPACTEVCPRQAVIFGKRSELLKEAKRRLAESPGRYVPKVYGETDGGGTQVLYLSHVPFEKLGLPTLGDEPAPQLARSIQHGVYRGFVAPVALYATLGLVMMRNRRSAEASRSVDDAWRAMEEVARPEDDDGGAR